MCMCLCLLSAHVTDHVGASLERISMSMLRRSMDDAVVRVVCRPLCMLLLLQFK